MIYIMNIIYDVDIIIPYLCVIIPRGAWVQFALASEHRPWLQAPCPTSAWSTAWWTLESADHLRIKKWGFPVSQNGMVYHGTSHYFFRMIWSYPSFQESPSNGGEVMLSDVFCGSISSRNMGIPRGRHMMLGWWWNSFRVRPLGRHHDPWPSPGRCGWLDLSQCFVGVKQ